MFGELDLLRVKVLVDDKASFDGRTLAEHGMSMLVEAVSGGRAFRVLFDLGASFEVLGRNARAMGVDLLSVDAVVLSHAHYDHTGGLEGFLRWREESDPPGDLLLVFHPSLLRPAYALSPFLRPIGLPGGPRALEGLKGVEIVSSRGPVPLGPGLWTSGEVPRREPLETTPPHMFRLSGDGLERDSLEEDLSIFAVVKGAGGVVLCGCCHAGILNVLSLFREMAPGVPIFAVVGGLHLVGASRERMDLTAERLRSSGVRMVVAGHCTGFEAMCALKSALGGALLEMHAGLELSLP